MSGCKCIAKEEAFAFECGGCGHAKINKARYQDFAGKALKQRVLSAPVCVNLRRKIPCHK